MGKWMHYRTLLFVSAMTLSASACAMSERPTMTAPNAGANTTVQAAAVKCEFAAGTDTSMAQQLCTALRSQLASTQQVSGLQLSVLETSKFGMTAQLSYSGSDGSRVALPELRNSRRDGTITPSFYSDFAAVLLREMGKRT